MEAIDTIYRMCGRRCPVNALVEDGRVVKIESTPGNFVTEGKVCGKVMAAVQLEYDPKRLTHPLRRVGEWGSTLTW
jgi:thiosulfate reductase/polysulfide reductase chain A